MTAVDSLKTRRTLKVGTRRYDYFSLKAAEKNGLGDLSRLPFSLKVLLENLLRWEDGRSVRTEDIKAIARWLKTKRSDREIAYRPARVLMQDFTGVPAVVDLAAMRDAMQAMGDDPRKINPLSAVDLVIDHSVMVDSFGSRASFAENVAKEYERNGERYAFLRWGQKAFANFRVVPPGTGICHQVNLEYLAQTVWTAKDGDRTLAYPDTLVGTDSHTTMVNGLSVLGWGVGGIEAEAAMLGQPISMLIPEVVGFKLTGKLKEGATATDLVLTVTQMLRKKGVVGKFVEFHGPGLDELALADRATIANMAPEYGATCGFFPIDSETIRYLKATGRSPGRVALVEAYAKTQGLWRSARSPDPVFTDTLSLDIGTVESSLAGPKRPQDRVALSGAASAFRKALGEAFNRPEIRAPRCRRGQWPRSGRWRCGDRRDHELHQHVEPDGDVGCRPHRPQCRQARAEGEALGQDVAGAGLASRDGLPEGGRSSEPSRQARVQPRRLRLHHLHRQFGSAARAHRRRHHQGRLDGLLGTFRQSQFRGAGQSADPGQLSGIAHAGAGLCACRLDADRSFERSLGQGQEGQAGLPRRSLAQQSRDRRCGPPLRQAVQLPQALCRCLRRRPFVEEDRHKRRAHLQMGSCLDICAEPALFRRHAGGTRSLSDIKGARALVVLGDSITTDHISPAGSIKKDGPAGKFLMEHGVAFADFNSYGARRGNHEVMMRGTFANIRLKNEMVPGTEGGITRHLPDGEVMSIYDAAMRYQAERVALVVIAGKEYGAGSSRDWAAKGPRLLGVKAVLAESFERIHRSNLIGMGVLPLQFKDGVTRKTLGLTGEEIFDVTGFAGGIKPGMDVSVALRRPDGRTETLAALCRIDTLDEVEYFRHGGILPYVLRRLRAPAA